MTPQMYIDATKSDPCETGSDFCATGSDMFKLEVDFL